jgi:rhodanese-related sulfurtransferase
LRDVSAGNAVLLDVRESDEWDAGHLKMAKLVPLSTLGGALPPAIVSGQRVYVHCKAGIRAAKAAAALKQMGCADVVALAEGYASLLSSGFPGA